MRGKLRDKHSATKKDSFRREAPEQRRSARREVRGKWLEQQLEDEDDFALDELDEGAEELEDVEEDTPQVSNQRA